MWKKKKKSCVGLIIYCVGEKSYVEDNKSYVGDIITYMYIGLSKSYVGLLFLFFACVTNTPPIKIETHFGCKWKPNTTNYTLGFICPSYRELCIIITNNIFFILDFKHVIWYASGVLITDTEANVLFFRDAHVSVGAVIYAKFIVTTRIQTAIAYSRNVRNINDEVSASYQRNKKKQYKYQYKYLHIIAPKKKDQYTADTLRIFFFFSSFLFFLISFLNGDKSLKGLPLIRSQDTVRDGTSGFFWQCTTQEYVETTIEKDFCSQTA